MKILEVTHRQRSPDHETDDDRDDGTPEVPECEAPDEVSSVPVHRFSKLDLGRRSGPLR